MSERIDINYSAAKNLLDLLKVLKEAGVPDNLHWRYIEKYQGKKAREIGIPLYGQFELTPLCNLDCKMCYVHLNNEQFKGARLLPGKWWKDLAFKAHSLGMMNAVLTGGECLTYPEFDEVYMFIRNLGVKVFIKTNGVLLNKERIAFFKKFQPRGIIISLYGSTNDVYNRVTGQAVFDIVYENILQLKNCDLPISIALTPNEYMYDDIKNIIDLVNQLSIPLSVNAMLFPPRKETGREICDLSPEKYVRIFKSLGQEESHSIVPQNEAELKECDITETPKVGLGCSAGRSFFDVSWNGIMSGCTNLDSLKVSLLENEFATAWELINADAISYSLPIECNECEFNNLCFNCTAYRQNRNDRGHCNLEVCNRTKIFVKEGYYQS